MQHILEHPQSRCVRVFVINPISSIVVRVAPNDKQLKESSSAEQVFKRISLRLFVSGCTVNLQIPVS